MRFFDLGRLYTDWDMILCGRKCLLSDSVDEIIDRVERGVYFPQFRLVFSGKPAGVTAIPCSASDDDYPFNAFEDEHVFGQVAYRYCYLLPEDCDE